MFLGPEGRKQLKELGDVSTIGIEIVVSLAVGYLGGTWLDEKFGTAPYLGAIGFFVGLAAAIRSLYRVARKVKQTLAKADPQDPTEPPSPPPSSP